MAKSQRHIVNPTPSERSIEAHAKSKAEPVANVHDVVIDELSKVKVICVKAIQRGSGRTTFPGTDVTEECRSWPNVPGLIKMGFLKTEPPTDWLKWHAWGQKAKTAAKAAEVPKNEPKDESKSGQDDEGADGDDLGEKSKPNAASSILEAVKALGSGDSVKHIKSVLDEAGVELKPHASKAEMIEARDEWLTKQAG